ncbi:MAG: hypothetical protein GY775_16055 [Candidatus Scalindua sp.]|nr:hypothetical protein [Candidatus Scalindua sp.]
MNACDSCFRNQLTAFEVWLDFGRTANLCKPPEQLPIVLQVVLSQAHRIRALMLLRHFLDLGPWAVNLALSVGVFPYVLKLLQDPTIELRQHIVGIWTRIMAFDSSCQTDLIKHKAHHHFISHLGAVLYVSPEQSVMAVFILAAMQRSHRAGQIACLKEGLHNLCISVLRSHHSRDTPLMRRWIIFCLAQLCWGFPKAQVYMICLFSLSLCV